MTRKRRRKQLKKLLKWWQKKLYLRDWDIEIHSVMPHEMAQTSRLGEVDYSAAAKEATIRICAPNPTLDDSVNQDIELTIVHELLHLHHIASQRLIECGTAEDVMHEIAINMTAKALVNLKQRTPEESQEAHP